MRIVGTNKRVIFHKLVLPEEALDIVQRHVDIKPVGVEKVPLEEAVGRVLAEDIIANIDVPPFDRASMDGYAVRSVDIENADDTRPVKLKLVGKVEVGQVPTIELKEGECIEIATGAMIPRGADSVVMVEYTKQVDNEVLIHRPVYPGENVVHTGTDISKGDVVLRRCTRLTHREIALLASLGIPEVLVFKKPTVGIISTGCELEDVGHSLPEGKIYDTNTYMLIAALHELGCKPIRYGIVPDDEKMLEDTILKAVRECDVVLVTGGTSAGVSDITYRVLGRIGTVLVHGLRIKPGKPTLVSIVDGKLVFGLPGYPNSALLVFHLLVKPVLLKMQCQEDECAEIEAKLMGRVVGEQGRRTYQPVILYEYEGELRAYPLSMPQGTITPLAYADGYVIVPEDVDLIDEGQKVKVRLLSGRLTLPDLQIIGSHDPALDKLISTLSQKYRIRQVNVGSMGGVYAIIRKCCDIAGMHVLDEETERYNIPILEKLNVRDAVLVRGYYRLQGIIVQRGNPKNIKSIEDFLRPDVRIVNRNKGAGTRILLDKHLRDISNKLGIPFSKLVREIKGYTYEVKTHNAVAVAILQGRADAGLGVAYVAALYNLDFIPLTWEEYDFLILKSSLKKKAVQEFLELLKSDWFRNVLSRLPGYKVPDDIGEIIWSR